MTAVAPVGVIDTVAGGGDGDGEPATATSVAFPLAVAVDRRGVVYLSDNGVDGVRRLDPDGTMTTVHRHCQPARTATGGPGAGDGIHHPGALLCRADGSLVVADAWARVIWSVTGEGPPVPLAAGGEAGGDGLDDDEGGDGGEGGEGRLDIAGLGCVEALAEMADGSLLVADTWHDRVLALAAGSAAVVAGSGAGVSLSGPAELFHPTGLAAGPGGWWVADAFHQTLHRLDDEGWPVSVLPTAGWPAQPGGGLALDPEGRLYVADPFRHAVVRLNPDGTVAVVAGTGRAGFDGDGGPADRASLNRPVGLAFDAASGSLLIADSRNHRLRRVGPDGTITTVAGNGQRSLGGDGGPGTRARLSRPDAVAVPPGGGRGPLVVADTGNGAVRRVGPDGTIATMTADGPAHPGGVTAGDRVVVADPDGHRVWAVGPDGSVRVVAGTGEPGFAGDGGPATGARLHRPSAVALLPSGDLLIADTRNHRVRRVGPNGSIETVAGCGRWGPGGDGGPAVEAELVLPGGVCAGADGDFYVADTFNHRVRRVDPAGTIQTVAGTGEAGCSGDGGPATGARLRFPTGVAFGEADGAGAPVLVVADTWNHRVRRVTAGGTIDTVAGTGEAGCSGDGGPAVGAELAHPHGVALGPGPALLVADTANDRVRTVVPGR